MYLSSPSKEKETKDGENDILRFGMSCMQGWRMNMEDAHISEANFDDGICLFGVFDGHGGSEVAEYVGDNYGRILKATPGYKAKDYEKALKQSFLAIDEEMQTEKGKAKLRSYQQENTVASMAGCTANVILVVGKKVYCANAGDSRSYMYTGTAGNMEAKPLSFDHKPESEIEKNRIQKAGGTIMMGRVNGNLNLSRAIGDFEYKQSTNLSPEEQMITSNPDIEVHDLNLPEDKFIIMGCDGVWEINTPEQICESIMKQINEGVKTSDIMGKVLDDGLAPDTSTGLGCDNMSGVLIVFKSK